VYQRVQSGPEDLPDPGTLDCPLLPKDPQDLVPRWCLDFRSDRSLRPVPEFPDCRPALLPLDFQGYQRILSIRLRPVIPVFLRYQSFQLVPMDQYLPVPQRIQRIPDLQEIRLVPERQSSPDYPDPRDCRQNPCCPETLMVRKSR